MWKRIITICEWLCNYFLLKWILGTSKWDCVKFNGLFLINCSWWVNGDFYDRLLAFCKRSENEMLVKNEIYFFYLQHWPSWSYRRHNRLLFVWKDVKVDLIKREYWAALCNSTSLCDPLFIPLLLLPLLREIDIF